MSWTIRMENNCTKQRELTWTISVFRSQANTFFPPPWHEYFHQFFTFYHSFRYFLQFLSDPDHWKIPKYLCIVMPTFCANNFNDMLTPFIIINTRKSNFSITASSNFVLWISRKNLASSRTVQMVHGKGQQWICLIH